MRTTRVLTSNNSGAVGCRYIKNWERASRAASFGAVALLAEQR